MDMKAFRMLRIVLCILTLASHGMIAFSHRIDNVTLKFIIDTMPILFPPSRISLHSCINNDDVYKLSRKLSNLYLTHDIHNNVIPHFDRRIYNDLEHQNLYVLDLDCSYSIEVLRQVDLNRMFVAPMRWLLLQDRRKLIDNDDNANITLTYNDSILEIFENLAVYPDSDVVLAKRFNGDFLQLTSVYRPNPQRRVMWEDRGNWTFENGLRMKTFDVASRRRRNLQQTTLKSAIVLMNNDSVNHLTDYMHKTIDPLAKTNYVWLLHLVNRMNATLNFTVVNDWGRKLESGIFDGMTGMLIRREIDIGGTSMAIVEDRMDLIKYVHLTTPISVGFVFRQPLLSSVKNIFILPFEKDVWIAIAVFLLVVFCSLYLSMKWEYYRNISKKSSASWKQTNIGKPTLGDDFLVLLGAFAQQGYSYEPFRISARIITLMILIASLSLYAAYTANIVALLQSPTDSIQTLSDLLHSRLTLAAEDHVYARYVFKGFRDPVRKAIYEENFAPKKQNANWLTFEEGVKRIRNESFAFHALSTKIYQFIQDTYLEDEKCSLDFIDYMNLMKQHLPLPKQSPYLEIIKNGALKLEEYGLKHRDEYRLLTRKPKCLNQGSFISIGFIECHFVIVTMGYGMLLSLIVFALELLWHKIQIKSTRVEETTPTVIEKNDLDIIEYTE